MKVLFAFQRAKHIIGNYPKGFEASAVLPLLDLAQRQYGVCCKNVKILHFSCKNNTQYCGL